MTPPADMSPPAKIELIQRSLCAFWFGLPGIVPVLGVPFAIVALAQHSRIKRLGALWNPARTYLYWGMVCARLGLTLTVILTVLIATTTLISL
jgi:hypothetical protein